MKGLLEPRNRRRSPRRRAADTVEERSSTSPRSAGCGALNGAEQLAQGFTDMWKGESPRWHPIKARWLSSARCRPAETANTAEWVEKPLILITELDSASALVASIANQDERTITTRGNTRPSRTCSAMTEP